MSSHSNSEKYNSKILNEITLNTDEIEAIFVKISTPWKQVVVGCVY